MILASVGLRSLCFSPLLCFSFLHIIRISTKILEPSPVRAVPHVIARVHSSQHLVLRIVTLMHRCFLSPYFGTVIFVFWLNRLVL